MTGEFLGQDYLNAAASFGSDLGSGILSTLGSAAGAASGVVNTVLGTSYNAGSNVGGYLSSLSQQPTSFVNNNVSPAFNSLGSSFNSLGSSISNMPSFVSSNFNMDSLTSGLSNMNAPNVVGAASGALNNFGGALNSFAGGSSSNNLQQTLQNKFNDMVASKPQQNFGSLAPIQQGNELTSLNFGNAPQLKQDTYKEQNPIFTIVGDVSQGRLPTTNEFLAPSSPIRMLTGGYVPESKQTSLLELTTPQRGTEGLLNSLAMVPAMSMERGVGGGIAKGFTRKGEKFVIEDAFKASSNYKPDLSTFYSGASKLTGDLPQVVKTPKDMAGITPAATIAVGTGVMGIGSLLYSGAAKNLDNFNKEASKYNPFGVKAEDTTGQLMTYNSAMEEVPYIPPTTPQKSISDNISDFLGGLIPKPTASTYIGEDGNVYSTGVPNTPSPTPSVLPPVQSPASPNVNPVTILPQPGNVPKAGDVISYSNFEVPESVNQYMIQNNVAWNDRNQIGDQTSRNLIGTNVIDPITGEQRKINNLDESLNYLKIKMDPERTPLNENDRREVDKLTMTVARQLYSNPNEKDARYSQGRIYGFYTNELAKDVQNNQLLTDTYRYNLVKNNISIPMNTNPFAAKAESSVALLKGSDNFGGDVLSGYLPKGLGLQGAEWDRALGKNNGMLDFTPALMKMQQSGGSASPYSTLAGLTSEKDLMKMPEVFRGGPAETSGKYTISQAVLDAEGKPTYALNDKKIMAQVFKPVEIMNGPASYTIPSNFISTPNIVLGESVGISKSDTIEETVPVRQLSAVKPSTVYVLSGKDKEGNKTYTVYENARVLATKDGQYGLYTQHGTNDKMFHLAGSGGTGAIQGEGLQINGEPPRGTLVNPEGRFIENPSGRNIIYSDDTKSAINQYAQRIFQTQSKNLGAGVDKDAAAQENAISRKALANIYSISNGISLDEANKKINADISARETGISSLYGYGASDLIRNVDVTGDKTGAVSLPYTFPDGGSYEATRLQFYKPEDINKAPNALIASSSSNDRRFANTFLPYNVPEGTSVPKLQLANIGNIINGEIIRPAGYTGEASKAQLRATKLGFTNIEDMINNPAILPQETTPPVEPQQYTSGGIPIGTNKDLLKSIKIGNMGQYESLIRPIGNTGIVTGDRGTQGGSYTGGISNPLNIIMSPESKRVGTSGGYNIYDTNTGQVAVPALSIPNLDITGYWKKPENTPLGRENAAKENAIPAQLPLISAPVAPIRYRITSDGEQVIDTSPQITSNLDWISSGINSLIPKGTGKFVLDESGQGGDIAPTLPIMAGANVKTSVGGNVANPNEFKQFANMQPIVGGKIVANQGSNVPIQVNGINNNWVLNEQTGQYEKPTKELNFLDRLGGTTNFIRGLTPMGIATNLLFGGPKDSGNELTNSLSGYNAQKEFDDRIAKEEKLPALTPLDYIGGLGKVGFVGSIAAGLYGKGQELVTNPLREKVTNDYKTASTNYQDTLIALQKSGANLKDKNDNIIEALPSDPIAFEKVLSNAGGLKVEITSEDTKKQEDAYKSHQDAFKVLKASEGQMTNLEKADIENQKFMNSISGENAEQHASQIAKRYLPSYENTGVGLLKIGDVAVEGLSDIEKAAGITPLYEKTNAYNLLPSQKFLAYNRPEGFTKTVDGLTVKTQGVKEEGDLGSKVIGGGFRLFQKGSEGAFNYTREKPLEATSMLILPTEFGIVEDVGAGLVTKLPAIARVGGKTSLQAAKIGLGSYMVGSDIANITGRDLISDRGLLQKTIVGKDASGNTIYADPSTSGWGTRLGQSGMKWGIMLGPGAESSKQLFTPKNTNELEAIRTPIDRAASSIKQSMIPLEQSVYLKTANKLQAIDDAKAAIRESFFTKQPKITKTLPTMAGEAGMSRPTSSQAINEYNMAIEKPTNIELNRLNLIDKLSKENTLDLETKTRNERFAEDAMKNIMGGNDVRLPPSPSEVILPKLQKSTTIKEVDTRSLSQKLTDTMKNYNEKRSSASERLVAEESPKLLVSLDKFNTLPQETTSLPVGEKIPQVNLGQLKESSSISDSVSDIVFNKYQGTPNELEVTGSASSIPQIGDKIVNMNAITAKKLDIYNQQLKDFNTKVETKGYENNPSGMMKDLHEIKIQKARLDVDLNDDVLSALSEGRVVKKVANDKDVSSRSPQTIREAFRKGFQEKYESKGWKDVKVVVKGKLLGSDRIYEVTGKAPVEGGGYRDINGEWKSQPSTYEKVSTIEKDGMDLKFREPDSSRLPGESMFNVERLLYNEKPEVPFRIYSKLFGEIGTRGKLRSESIKTSDQRLIDQYNNANTEASPIKEMTLRTLSVIEGDKLNHLARAVELSREKGSSWNSEVEKLPKTLWDLVNIKNERIRRYEVNKASGKFTDNQLAKEKLILDSQNKIINDAMDSKIGFEFKPDGSEFKVVKLGDMVKEYNVKAASGIENYRNPQAIHINTQKMDPYSKGLFGDISAAAITQQGLSDVKTKDTDIMKPDRFTGARYFNVPSGELVKVKENEINKVASAKYKGNSGSASSGKALSLLMLPSDMTKKSSKSSISTLSELISSKPSGSKGSKISSPSGERRDGSGSSQPSSGPSYFSSSSSISSSSSSYSPSSSSSYSQSSSSSMAPFARGVAGVIPGFPWMVPPGSGGGGGSGGQGHGSAIVQNPLVGLSVAGRSGKFFNFGGINNFVKSISGNTKNLQTDVVSTMNQPDGTKGSFNVVKGAASSLSEASAIARKSKKRNVVVKRKVEKRSELNFDVPEFNLPKSKKNDLKIKMPSAKKLTLNFGIKKSSIKKGRL